MFRKLSWIKPELPALVFKKSRLRIVVEAFAEHCSTGPFTLKFYHSVNTIQGLSRLAQSLCWTLFHLKTVMHHWKSYHRTCRCVKARTSSDQGLLFCSSHDGVEIYKCSQHHSNKEYSWSIQSFVCWQTAFCTGCRGGIYGTIYSSWNCWGKTGDTEKQDGYLIS